MDEFTPLTWEMLGYRPLVMSCMTFRHHPSGANDFGWTLAPQNGRGTRRFMLLWVKTVASWGTPKKGGRRMLMPSHAQENMVNYNHGHSDLERSQYWIILDVPRGDECKPWRWARDEIGTPATSIYIYIYMCIYIYIYTYISLSLSLPQSTSVKTSVQKYSHAQK